jgi:hypothetical protein
MKTQTAWAIVSGNIILPYTIRHTRTLAINDMQREIFGDYTWKEAKKSGYRCVKIIMEEAMKESK